MTKVLNLLWRGWMVILGTVLTVTMGIPVLLFSIRRSHYKYAYFFIRLWCLGMFYGMGFRYTLTKLSGEAADKNTQYVVIANHTSLMDIMLPCILMPHHPLCYVGKKELVKIPIFGIIYKRVCVMVDRSSAKSRADVYRRCAERMAEGDSIVLFPEGGVPDDTSIILDDFKDGAFTLSSKHHVPIAVFTFQGLREMFPFDKYSGYPGRVQVFFNGIMQPKESMEEMKAEAHAEIKKVLDQFYT